jgi:hypothetical protein
MLLTFNIYQALTSTASARSRDPENKSMRSVSGNHDDGDDNQCRDQRKRAIKCFRSGPCGGVGRRHGLCRLPQVANEPADISGLHRIGRYRDFFDMIAFGAVKRAKFKSPGPGEMRASIMRVRQFGQWSC